MEKAYRIRVSQEKDASGILKLIKKAAGESDHLSFGKGEFQTSLEDEKLFIKNINKSSGQLILVAHTESEEIIGTLTITTSPRPRISHCGELGIIVLKKYWGKGVGRAMMIEALKWGDHSPLSKIKLTVKDDNSRAVRLYQSLGFEEEGILRNEFIVNDHYISAIMMSKIITKTRPSFLST